MKRGAPMKRSAWPRSQPAGEKRPERIKPVAVPLARPPVYWQPANEPALAQPKTEPQRNAALLALARDMPCLLRVPGICTDNRATTVAAHSNFHQHGKAGARKADDHYSVWACARCHHWLDGSFSATLEQKRDAFLMGHARQVHAWRKVAGDAGRPERDRAAARWALEKLI